MNDKLKDKYSLPKEFKEAWIKALKGGNYVQGAGTLRKNPKYNHPDSKETYCCLGVACAVAGVPEEYISGEWINYIGGYEYDAVPEILHGGSDENELVDALSCMNDSYRDDSKSSEEHKFSFEDIADWIDDNIKAIQ